MANTRLWLVRLLPKSRGEGTYYKAGGKSSWIASGGILAAPPEAGKLQRSSENRHLQSCNDLRPGGRKHFQGAGLRVSETGDDAPGCVAHDPIHTDASEASNTCLKRT